MRTGFIIFCFSFQESVTQVQFCYGLLRAISKAIEKTGTNFPVRVNKKINSRAQQVFLLKTR